jgi:inorganic phosphate transporter, PiT family
MHDTWVVWSIIGLALIFDYVNGMHDAANSIATIVSTRVMKPQWAVVWAAFFNFAAFLFFGLHVAKTIGRGVVEPSAASVQVITAGLVGAIAWNVITWLGGIPSSSSHALVGGLVGAAVAAKGFGALVTSGVVKIGVFIIVAPLLGMVIGVLVILAVYWLFHRAHYAKMAGIFSKLQFLSAALYSLGHGGNDAQKTMGIIFAVLAAANWIPGSVTEPPFWVVIACHVAMGLGTLAGGWRIVKTMGQKICALQPVHGFAAETAGAVCLYGATWLGIPVSTTHTITGAIVGVGATRGRYAVRWAVAGRLVWAWILTIPCAGLTAALTLKLFDLLNWK